MISIKVDVAGALASLKSIREDQLPFAIARAINSCAYESRLALINKVASTYKFRTGTGWLRGGGAQGKGWFYLETANKRHLEAVVSTDEQLTYRHLWRESNLGGVKYARKSYLAVPLGALQQRKIPADLQPQAVMASFGFMVTAGGHQFIAVRSTKKGWGIQATSPRLKGVQLLYVLMPSVRVAGQKITDMHSIVNATVARVFPQALEREMANAIRTAR